VGLGLYQATGLLDLFCEWVIGGIWRHLETEALLAFVTAQHPRLLCNVLEADTFVQHIVYDVTLGGDDDRTEIFFRARAAC
jgi:hypothetical protein